MPPPLPEIRGGSLKLCKETVVDSAFYGLGKTNYMFFESVVTNVVYYGAAVILYATNV